MRSGQIRVMGVVVANNGDAWFCRESPRLKRLAEQASELWMMVTVHDDYDSDPTNSMLQWVADHLGGVVIQDFVAPAPPKGAEFLSKI